MVVASADCWITEGRQASLHYQPLAPLLRSTRESVTLHKSSPHVSKSSPLPTTHKTRRYGCKCTEYSSRAEQRTPCKRTRTTTYADTPTFASSSDNTNERTEVAARLANVLFFQFRLSFLLYLLFYYVIIVCNEQFSSTLVKVGGASLRPTTARVPSCVLVSLSRHRFLSL